MFYKLADNGIQVLESNDGKEFVNYCILDINYNGFDYKFCMGECNLEGCTGIYHTFTELEDVIIYNIGDLDLLTVDDCKRDILNPQTLTEIKENINILRDAKSLWFDYNNHLQRFSDSDITKIKLMREGLTIQPLFEPSTSEPIYEVDGITQKQGKLFAGINWKYPKMDINGDFIQDEYEWVMVTEPQYFTYMLGRGGLNMTLCFEAQRLTLEELTIFDDTGSDLSTFEWENIFNGHYDTLVAPYL